jgi:non-heme chloroperoxidase
MPDFTASDGARLAFEREGSGPTVIMVHGFAASPRVFDAQARVLAAQGCTVYRPHLRGHGQSAGVTHGGRMARLAGDLRDLIQAEGLERVHMIGWSMGCSIIWSYLDAFGDAVVASQAFLDEIPYVLESVETVGQPVTRIESSPLTGLHGRFADPASRVAAVQDFVAGMLRSATEVQREAILDDAARGATACAIAALLNSNATDFRDLIPRLKRPTLFVSGGQSFFRPAFFHWIASAAPHARVVELHDHGHFLPIEAGDAISDCLVAFIDAQSPIG